MRFLCFHGSGTNAKVFENQTARLRQALGGDHEFVFVNGPVESEPVFGLEPASGGSFCFYNPDFTKLRAIYYGLIKLIRTQGPFDGLMGFSEGGAVAAGLLVLDGRHRFAQFKCGVFFCAPAPSDPQSIVSGQLREMSVRADGGAIRVPTAHIWSSLDQLHPNMGKALVQLCDSALREEYVHELGHTIPTSMSSTAFQRTVRVLERTMERAKDLDTQNEYYI